MKVALYALLLLTLNSQLSTTWAQSQAYRIANLNNIRFADQFPGADAGEKIANCIADLPATGGTCDARGLEGAQTISSTLTIDKPINLLLGAASYTLSSGVRIDLTSNEVAIIGLGRSATAINSPSAAEAIRLGALAGSSVSRCALKDLTVTKTGTVREAGSIGIVQYGGQSNRYEYIQVISFEKGILLDGDGGDVPMVEVPMESVRLSQNLIGLDMTTPITTVFSRGMVIVGPGQATVG
ncbi:MAG: hypothetical protein HYS33_01310, partial [Acidobacteria bacterium]|nr:hypothetical protein [Acidobacteriota bacterium]